MTLTTKARRKAAYTAMDLGAADDQTTVILQHWRGHVISVEPETFWVALGVATGGGLDLYAQIYTRELSAEDQAELSAGRWVELRIGTRCDARGTHRAFSEIQLVKVAPWTAQELADADQLTQGWVGLFERDEGSETAEGVKE